jgi:putative hydrolase of the HAD superfamily
VLLLDLDNTLVDRDAAFEALFRELLARVGTDPDSPRGSRALADLVRSDDRGRTDRDAFLARALELAPELGCSVSELRRHHATLPERVRPVPGVRALLERLAKHRRLRVVSNGSGDTQRRKLTSAGLDGLFESVWISGEQGVEKPDPGLFLAALSDTPPAEAIMVGDDSVRDIAPARSLGMGTVHVDPAHHRLRPLPHAAIARILQLEELLTCST